MARAFSFVALATLLGLAVPASAHASSALELVRLARAHESAREPEIAVRRYMEALSLDATCGEAYLGLGSLRARRGDLREAERVYSVALERLPELRAAQKARAHVRRALGMRREAVGDLLGGAEDDPSALRVLAGWYGEDGQAPAQLATWRKIRDVAEASGDAVLLHEAKTTVRALVILVGPADPAAAPPDERGIRAVLAGLARKGG
jgi:tetratricopeptide (TPR) repeat protein